MGASPDLPDEHHHRPLRGQHPRQRDHRDGAAPLHPHAAEIPQVNFRITLKLRFVMQKCF